MEATIKRQISLETYYDKEADVLYISFGQPAKAETIDTGGDVLIRVAPDTGEMVGLTILNYSDYLSRIRA
ncbi:MAG: DUF2283 domain-containing protein [Thermodesulfobacteriota bacterium]|nr:MAG: DUF2283 domain-containing protein [Thermodesulfobacteriota bacterium]